MKPHPSFLWAGTQTEMLPSPLSPELLLSFRSPALWEALPGASGASQPEIHPCSKQAFIVLLLGAAGSCCPVSAVLQTLSRRALDTPTYTGRSSQGMKAWELLMLWDVQPDSQHSSCFCFDLIPPPVALHQSIKLSFGVNFA